LQWLFSALAEACVYRKPHPAMISVLAR